MSLFASLGAGGGLANEIETNHQSYEALPDTSKALLEEALKLVEQEGSVERVKEIFSSSSDLDINIRFPQIYGETLLYAAVEHGLAMVKVLLECGADPSVGNMMDSQTPLDLLLELEKRTSEQEEMLKLLKQHSAKKSPSVEQAIEQERRDLLWAIGEDPDEVDALQDRDDIISILYLRQLGQKLDWAANNLSRDEIDFKIKCNKGMAKVRKSYDGMSESTKALLKEAFHLLTINAETDEANYESAEQAVRRVKEIISHKDVSPNFLSYESGESLLFLTVSNFRLEEDGKHHAVELVKALLEAGADPNLENVIDRDTALDYLDYNFELDELSNETKQIIQLLKEKGAKILPKEDDNGKVIGERGEGEGFHDKARREASESAE